MGLAFRPLCSGGRGGGRGRERDDRSRQSVCWPPPPPPPPTKASGLCSGAGGRLIESLRAAVTKWAGPLRLSGRRMGREFVCVCVLTRAVYRCNGLGRLTDCVRFKQSIHLTQTQTHTYATIRKRCQTTNSTEPLTHSLAHSL